MSYDNPRIWRGKGRLSAAAFNRQQEVSNYVAPRRQVVQRTMDHPDLKTQGRMLPYFLGRITSATPVSGASHRWLYEFEEIRYDVTADEFVTVQPPTGQTVPVGVTGQARSLIEYGNDGAVVMPGVEVSNIPATFTVKPLEIGCPVLVLTCRATDGTAVFVISPIPNAIDGPCE